VCCIVRGAPASQLKRAAAPKINVNFFSIGWYKSGPALANLNYFASRAGLSRTNRTAGWLQQYVLICIHKPRKKFHKALFRIIAFSYEKTKKPL
jgi:hypothetical protein